MIVVVYTRPWDIAAGCRSKRYCCTAWWPDDEDALYGPDDTGMSSESLWIVPGTIDDGPMLARALPFVGDAAS